MCSCGSQFRLSADLTFRPHKTGEYRLDQPYQNMTSTGMPWQELGMMGVLLHPLLFCVPCTHLFGTAQSWLIRPHDPCASECIFFLISQTNHIFLRQHGCLILTLSSLYIVYVVMLLRSLFSIVVVGIVFDQIFSQHSLDGNWACKSLCILNQELPAVIFPKRHHMMDKVNKIKASVPWPHSENMIRSQVTHRKAAGIVKCMGKPC